MSFTSGKLDSLLNMTFDVDTLANLTYVSGAAANGTPTSVTAHTGKSTYATFDSLQVTSVDDATNTIVVTGTASKAGDGYSGGTVTMVPWTFTVVGQVGSDLLLAANGAAAVTALPASTVAADIQGGNSGQLNSDLFVFAVDGAQLGTAASQTLTFLPLSSPVDTVAMALASTPTTPVPIVDSAAAVQGSLDALQGLVAGGTITGITLTDQATPTLTVSAAQLSGDSGALGEISSGYSLAVTGVTAANATAVAATAHVTQVQITDSAADVSASLDALQGLVAGGKIGGITLTDQGTAALTVSTGQITADAGALADISGSYSLTVTGATVATASTIATMAHVGLTEVTDTSASVLANIGALNTLAAAGHALSISLTDTGTPNIALTPTQLAADTAVLKDITSDFTMTIDGSAANISVAGIAGRGTTVTLSGTASQYTVTPDGDGVGFTLTDTGTGRTSIDHFSNVTALQFSDGTDFIAVAPGTNGNITTGNVTELYSAVLARVPDVGGLAFYQSAVAANPSLGLNQLGQYFLSSTEYTSNPEHNYAQSAAGDAQFITDTFTNLLHRAPDTGAVPFYQNVINQFTNGLAPGTAAYAAAELAGHAQVLVYFSVSAEFLSDVQITAQNPPDAQHFLHLI